MSELPNTLNPGSGAQVMPPDLTKVAAEFTKVFDAVMSVDSDRSDARDLMTAASETSSNTRIAALVSIAGAAAKGMWSTYDVEQALDKSLSRRNSVDTSIKTFAGELKRACHAKVRNHVPALVALASDVWAAETAATKATKGSGPGACHKAFTRMYHMLVLDERGMFGEAIRGRVFANATEVTEWGLSCDPDLDFVKVFKRLRAIRAQIAGFAQDFPVPGFADVIEYIDAIEKDDLKASRDAPVVETAPVIETVSETVSEPAVGISSLVDDALAEMAA